MVKCIRVSVICLENTIDEIKRGGPKYFGFTFDIDIEQKDEILDFIATRLTQMKLPLKGIYCDDEIDVKSAHVWDKDKIIASFEKHEEELVKEIIKQKKSNIKR